MPGRTRRHHYGTVEIDGKAVAYRAQLTGDATPETIKALEEIVRATHRQMREEQAAEEAKK